VLPHSQWCPFLLFSITERPSFLIAASVVCADVENLRGLSKGWWDSIHVFEVTEQKKGTFDYKLTTTVMISMGMNNGDVGEVDLSGSMTQQVAQILPVTKEQPHIANLGKMLEDLELKIRQTIEGIYIQKTKEVVNGMRVVPGQMQQKWEQITKSLNEAVGQHGKGRKTDSD